METIVVSLIGGLSVAIPSLITTILSNRKSTVLMEYKIDRLAEKVHEHNNLIDRMYKIENRVSIIEEEIKK